MTPIQRGSFGFAVVTVLLLAGASARLHAQESQPVGWGASTSPAATAPASTKPTSSQSFAASGTAPIAPTAPAGSRIAPSMLDEPASPAKVVVSPAGLTIVASNASLTDVIRQVALQTSMQVEGNSREERVFGVYGPGSPPEVLSALLYDSGYNVLMVGTGADGVPRRLVLSQRASRSAQTAASAQAPRNSDEDDEPDAQEAPPPQPAPALQSPQPTQVPGAGEHGGVRTPQQMLEELQKMHTGQQPQDVPKDPQ